jgi:hypothetical protein
MKTTLRLWILLLPFVLFYGGAGMNLAVISANKGAMPVVMPFDAQCVDASGETDLFSWAMGDSGMHPCQPGESLHDGVHRVAAPTDHLKILEDWIQIPGMGIASIGDCFLWLGDWLEMPMLGAWFALLLLKRD